MQIEPRTEPTQETAPVGVSRRTLLRGAAVAGVVGVTGATLAACGGDDDKSTGASGGGASSAVVAKTADIPVGGGQIVDGNGQKIVVTQPESGDFKAFTAICTHQGCTVNKIEGGIIFCPCHGSQYSAADGSVKAGPAPKPLAGVNITVSGQDIKLS
jgi:Rieske Fe-S protein